MSGAAPELEGLTLVTGGSGFVGLALVRALRARGARVRALVRRTSDTRRLAPLGVELLEGELRDPDSLRRSCAGVRRLFHAAADYRLWHPRPAELYAANVAGTESLMRAAQAAGLERVVHTSSVATLGLRPDGTPSDEETPVGLEDMVGHYKRSKFLAEEVVRRMAREEGLPAVIVNPSAPVGPGDARPTPTGRMVLDAARGAMPAYVDTGLNLVHVDDVAEGQLAALASGRTGERYVLGGRDMSLRAILEEVARLCGHRPPRLRLKPGWLLPLAHGAQAFARLRGGAEPRLTVEGLKLARKHMYFSSAKAIRELGYAPARTDCALADAIEWFRQAGRLG
jgi:dihydroflavonol-4-reductase